MSSKRRLRRQQHGTKRAFTREVDAQRAAAAARRRTGEDIQAYRCRHCRHWHIGHRSSRILRY